MVPSQYLLLCSVQTQIALGHQTLDTKPSRKSLAWIMHRAEEIFTSWTKKNEMRFVKLAQDICSVLIRWYWQLSRTVTAFLIAWGLMGSGLSCNTPFIRVADLASIFIIILDHLLLSSPAAALFAGLIFHDPSLISLGCSWGECWWISCSVGTLKDFRSIWIFEATHLISLRHSILSYAAQIKYFSYFSLFFFLTTRPVSLKSLSSGNMLHFSYGGPSKLLLLEVLCTAEKSRGLHWHSKRTYHFIRSVPTGEEVALVECCTLAISDLCNMFLPHRLNQALA